MRLYNRMKFLLNHWIVSLSKMTDYRALHEAGEMAVKLAGLASKAAGDKLQEKENEDAKTILASRIAAFEEINRQHRLQEHRRPTRGSYLRERRTFESRESRTLHRFEPDADAST